MLSVILQLVVHSTHSSQGPPASGVVLGPGIHNQVDQALWNLEEK